MTLGSWPQSVADFFRRLRLDSIKSRTVLFAILATLIPSLSTAWISYTQNWRALTEKITGELVSVSAQAAREMDLWLKLRIYDVRVFASSYEVSENVDGILRGRRQTVEAAAALARLKDYLGSVQDRFVDYQELLVVDPEASLIATGTGDSSALNLPADWLGEVQRDQAVLGDAYWDASAGKALVMVAVPIKAADGRFVGALAAKLDLGAVAGILQSFSPGASGRIYLVTGAGELVISSEATSAGFLSSALSDAAAQRLFANEGVALEYDDPMGTNVIGILKQAPRLGWAVVAEVPEAEAFAQVKRLRNLTALLVSGLLLGIGLIAYWLGLMIVRPLDRLTTGAGEVATGDLAVDLPIEGGGEVADLTRVFNHMVARLRKGRQELDATNEALSRKNEELARLSAVDGLTGLYNRRHVMETLANESRRALRLRHPYAVLMIDVDHLKKYTDSHGHLAGDEVLTRCASVARESTREVDCAARYGGEEFLILLPETALDRAAEVAERVRARMESETFQVNGKVSSVTLSLGAAEFPKDGDTPEKVIASADAALYRAKQRGRNRVARTTRQRAKKEAEGSA